MNNNTNAFVLTLSVPVLLGACTSNNTNVIEESRLRGTPQVVDDQRLISNSDLAQDISLTGIIEGETAGGFRKVEAQLFNQTNKFRNVRYQFVWFDEDNFQVDGPLSAWTTVGIAPTAYARITSVAPHPRAVDFQLNVRPAK